MGISSFADRAVADPGVEKIIEEFYAAYQKLDIPKLLSVLSDECFFEDPTFHLSADGKIEIKKMAEKSFQNVSNVKITLENRIVCSNWVVTQQRLSALIISNTDGTQKSKEFSVRGASIFEIKQGKIKRWTDYYDILTFKKQTA